MASSGCKFKKVLIANRGEISVRISRTLLAMGIESHVLYSAPDSGALHVRSADQAHALSGSEAKDTYLNSAKIIAAAKKARVDAVHPGYGFLSENAEFARSLERAGISFIGPRAGTMGLLGDKTNAKKFARGLKIPVLEAFALRPQDYDRAALNKFTAKAGFPLVIKAAAGGGGRGMRVVRQAAELYEAIESAAREAASAFGNDALFIERYLETVRHVEVQIAADNYGAARHIFDRDCSLQRSHQKVIEEAPANLPAGLRTKIHRAAEKLCAAARYNNLGTVEFLVDSKNNFYFLEVNSRLQVEHTVTEEITGLDLVALQIEIAQGARLKNLLPKKITVKGHAIQCRVCAESPERNFTPNTGIISEFTIGEECRLDSGFEKGDKVTPFYDSLIAKIIVHRADRKAAVSAALAALDSLELFGVVNNSAFLTRLLSEPAFKRAAVTTGFIADFLKRAGWGEYYKTPAALFQAWTAKRAAESPDVWNEVSGWRLSGGGNTKVSYLVNDAVEVTADLNAEASAEPLKVLTSQGASWIACQGGSLKISPVKRPERALAARQKSALRDIKSLLPGKITKVWAAAGDSYKAGQELIAVESMKMEHIIRAENDLVVEAVAVKAGDFVAPDALLIAVKK